MRVSVTALSVLAALSFPKGISAIIAQDICKSFQGVTAASKALAWCDTLYNKCCTDDDGNVSADACGNWSPNAEYNLCEGSCRGTNSCLNMLTNAATDSSISVKKGACVSRSLNVVGNIFGVCENFARENDGVVNATIGNRSCSGVAVACKDFARDGDGDITVDIQDGACSGGAACDSAFKNAGSGSSILIKEKGCVGKRTCEDFARSVDGVVTASIGKGACSGKLEVCSGLLGEAEEVIMIDIQDEACSGGDRACYEVGLGAEYLQSLTVPAGECSTENNACNSCGYNNTSVGGLALTTECCNTDNATDVDDSCLYSDALSMSSVPSMTSQPSNLPSSEPTWKDDKQCKKVDPDNDICFKLGGRCKSDCEDDDNFVCVPNLCSYDKKWDKRVLMEGELELVEIEVSAIGNTGRELKSTKAPKAIKVTKATKAPKSSCACRVPKANKCN